MKLIPQLILCLFFSTSSIGQIYPSWISTSLFPNANSSTTKTVDIDASGNIIVAGSIYDIDLPDENIFVAKYNPGGEIIWLQTYGCPDTVLMDPNTLCVDNLGNAYITYMKHSAAASYWSITVQKYNGSDGTILWTSELTEAQFNGFEWQVKPKYMTIDNNHLYVCGTKFEAGISGSKMLVMKVDFNGSILWTETHNGSGIYANSKCITTDESGNVYIAGDAWNASIDYCVVKFDPNGNLIWDAFLDGEIYHNTDIAESILVDGYGNVYITGYNQISSNLTDIVTAKYDQDGNFQWSQSYGNPGYRDNNAYYLEMTENGDLLVGGYSAYEDPYPGTGKDYILLKYSATGTLLWDARYDYNNFLNDHPFDFDMDTEGNVYICGITMKHCNIHKSITAVKITNEGETEWDIRVPNLYGTPWELAVIDVDKFVVVAGAFDTIQVNEATTIHYEAGMPPNYEADMIDIYFESQILPPVIDYENQTVIAFIHDTANIEFLIPYITNSEHACMYPDDGVVTSYIEPIWYNITSFDDQIEKWWIVHIEGGYVGKTEKINIDFQIFPIPTKDKLQIQCSDFITEGAKIEILNLYGKQLYEIQISKGSKKLELNLENLVPGIYLCTISINNMRSTKKIIIE